MDEFNKLIKTIEDSAKLALISVDKDYISKYSLGLDYVIAGLSTDYFKKVKSTLTVFTEKIEDFELVDSSELYLLKKPLYITSDQKLNKIFIVFDDKTELYIQKIGLVSNAVLDMQLELQKNKQHVSKIEKRGIYKLFTWETDQLKLDIINKTIAEDRELEVLRDLYLTEMNAKIRVMADFQNYRKRIESQQREYTTIANKVLINHVIEVIDDSYRANNDAPHKGLELLIEKLKSLLAEQGLEEIKIDKGDKFNPEIMEALANVPGEKDQEPGTVIHVDQRGYKYLSSNIIHRPAKVIIAK